ncbi:MAG: EAL domain-containing protein [Azonexus sp.]
MKALLLPPSDAKPAYGLFGKLRTSLVAKVSLIIGTVSVGSALFFGAAGEPFIRDFELNRQLANIGELLSTVESTVSIVCFTGDQTLARELAQGLMTNQSIAAVRIASNDGVLIELKKRGDPGDTHHLVQRAVFSPFKKNTQVGEIILTADSNFILEQAATYSRFFSSLLLLEVIAVTAAVALVILRTIVRPITGLSDELQQFAAHPEQNLTAPHGNQQNEIGHLAKIFNHLINSLSCQLSREHALGQEFARSEERFRTLAENSPDIIARYDKNLRLNFANPSYARETGIPLEFAVNRPPDDLRTWRPAMPPEQFQARLRRVMETGQPDCLLWEWQKASGEQICHEMHIVAEYEGEGNPVGTLAIGRNISERKNIEQQLLHQATHDVLTGLPNRSLLKDRLQHALAQSRRDGRRVAVIFIDLDNFKDVNDSLGHNVGDELLKLLAARLLAILRESDTVARLGGDEFVILLEDSTNSHDLDAVVQKAFETISQPCDIDQQRIYPGASMGIAVHPGDGDDADSLMRNADTAMYVAKERGRNDYRFFASDMNEELHRWIELSNDLHCALERQEFSLHYQAKARLDNGEQAGMEALIRWTHPKHGQVSPAIFIPVAEKSGLIGVIGQWVLNEACRQARAWLDEGLDPGRVAVNLSAIQCQGSQLPDEIRHILETHGLSGKHLEVEITESIVMADTKESIRAFWALRDMGVRVSVDDFGTGYSSLSYLKRLPVDNLKIDKSFIDDIETDRNDEEIIRAIIAMAHSLNLEVIAEGVETLSQLERLQAAGCDQIQGYYFSRPLPASQMTTRLGAGQKLVMTSCSASPAIPERVKIR